MQAMRWMCVQVRSVASRYDFAPFITPNFRLYFVGFRAGEAAAEGACSFWILTVVYPSHSTSTSFAYLAE
jgi:hypothetical protein